MLTLKLLWMHMEGRLHPGILYFVALVADLALIETVGPIVAQYIRTHHG
jgi:hypothetical protein